MSQHACTGTNLCSVAMLETYMAMASMSPGNSDSYLEELCMQTKNESKLREKGGLSYTTICKAVIAVKLEAIRFDKCQCGLYSLRAGGASAAANAGVLDRMFKWHGH